MGGVRGAQPADADCASRPRRFVVEISPTANGRVVGTVQDGEGVVTFSGWLDLLRLLEPAAASDPAPGS